MKLFLPFLTNDQGLSLKEENAVVVTRAIPDPLQNSPDGWEGNTIQFARNNEFRAVIKSYTTALKFYLEGAKILRNAFYTIGMEVVLYFIWLKQNVAFGAGMKYEGWYKGEPDFGTFKDDYNGVEISITEGGFFKDLQANKAITYEIPFDTDAVKLYMDGLDLHQKLNYQDVADLDISKNLYTENFFGPYPLTSQDGSSVGFLIGNENLEAAPSGFANKLASTNIILRNLTGSPVDVTIAGTIEFQCTSMTSSPAWAMKFRYLKSNMPISVPNQDDYKIIETVAMVVGDVYSEDFSLTLTLAPYESLLREGVFFGGVGSDAIIQFTDRSKSTISFITRQPPNIVDAWRVFDLGNKLTAKVSPGTSLTSPLLEPDFNLLVTCGDALRNIPGAKVKTTFSDYHKSVDAVKCIALEVVNNNPVISSRYDKFNKASVISNLGECSNWSLEPASDYIYDSAEVGYPAKSSQSNDDVNGKYSFNNTYLWKLNVTRRKVNQYSAKSVYYADPYDIELIRVNFNQKDTTTANTDNTNFFIDAEKKTDVNYTGSVSFLTLGNKLRLTSSITGILPFLSVGMKIQVTDSVNNSGIFTITNIVNNVLFSNLELTVAELITVNEVSISTIAIYNLYQLRRKTYASITGIPNDGTIFNLELSPRRNLSNHLRWLRSSFDHLDMYKLVMSSTDKNADLVTTDTEGNVISEKADILVSAMGERVYLPYLNKFLVKSPYNLLTLVTANNSGVFQYTMGGVSMDGFIINIATDDATLESQEYTLLQSANNDNLQLINNR